MPVIVVVGAVTLVTAVSVTGLRVTPVKAAAIVGVTDVTTVSPGVPLTPLTTLAKVGLTLVTHVAADAEDNSPTLRLPTVPTVTAARSVWFEADANSANRTPARRGIMVCFDLAITPPLMSPGLALSIVSIRVHPGGFHLCPLRDIPLALFAKGKTEDESESPRSLSTLIATCLAGLGRRRNAPGQMRSLSTFRGTVMHFGNGFDHARFTKSSP